MKRKTLSNHLAMATCSLSAVMGLSTQAAAQSQGAALEEIIVTAQRRAENLQDVPIAISAFSENFLIETGVTEVAELPMLTPGLTYTKQLGAAVPVLRGVGNPGTNIGQESSIATYVDDVYYSMPSGADISLNNVERIEVLKGPQGTLFGRNSTGGLIHIITKEPSRESSGNVELSYGSYDTTGINFYGTVGLSDTAAIDLAARYEDQADGWGENLATGKDVHEGDDLMVRSKVLIEPGEATKITLSMDYFENDGSYSVSWRQAEGALGLDGAATYQYLVTPPPGGLGLDPATAAPIAAGAATKAPDDYYDINTLHQPRTKHEQWGLSAKIEHQFGDMDFVSITAYRDGENLRYFNQDATVLGLIEVNMPAFSETLTQEFRLSGTMDRLKWIAGVFYLDEEIGWDDGRGSLDIVSPLFAPFSRLNTAGTGDNTSWAVFSEGSYDLTESTSLTLGVRYTEDEKEISGTHNFYAGPVNAFQLPWAQDATFDETTWRLSLEHNLSEDAMVYASYNRGFKAGLLDLIATAAAAGFPINITQPEILDAYEVGFKSELMEGRVRVNGAAFYYDFTDKHEQVVQPGGSSTINAAQATMQGGEVEVLAVVTDGLSIHAGLSIIDSEYDSFPAGQQFTPTGIGGNAQSAADHKGNNVSRAPEMTYNLGFVHELPTASGMFTTSLNYYYNDGFYWEPENRLEQDSYSIVNAQIAWASEGGFNVGLYGNNLGDEEYLSFGLSDPTGDLVSVAAPRTYGIKVGLDF